MTRFKFAFAAALFFWLLLKEPRHKVVEQTSPNSQVPNAYGRLEFSAGACAGKNQGPANFVFSLTADDFILTDNGVPQPVQMEADTLSQPLALAVIVQTGGLGASHLA